MALCICREIGIGRRTRLQETKRRGDFLQLFALHPGSSINWFRSPYPILFPTFYTTFLILPLTEASLFAVSPHVLYSTWG